MHLSQPKEVKKRAIVEIGPQVPIWMGRMTGQRRAMIEPRGAAVSAGPPFTVSQAV